MKSVDNLIFAICNNNIEIAVENVKSSNFKWDTFFNLIEKHRIAPQILDRLLRYPIHEYIKTYISQRAKSIVKQVLIDNTLVKSELDRIVELFNKNNIDMVLMKGLSIDNYGLRITRDLDILIKDNDLFQAMDLLKAINYKYVGNTRNPRLTKAEKNDIKLQMSWSNQYELLNSDSGLLLELHTNLFQRKRYYTVNLNKLLDNIDLFSRESNFDNELNCKVFSNNHRLLLACMHNAINRCPSNNTFILRTLLDIDTVIKKGVDWKNFLELSKQLEIEPFIYFSILMYSRFFQSHIPGSVLNELENNISKIKKFMINLHLKAYRNLSKNSLFLSNFYKVAAPFVFNGRLSDKIKWGLLLPLILPPRYRMSEIFNIDHHSPLIYLTYLINPFRWVYLIFRDIYD